MKANESNSFSTLHDGSPLPPQGDTTGYDPPVDLGPISGSVDFYEKSLYEGHGFAQVNHDLSAAPDIVLANLEKIGADDEDYLNEYEISFILFIFDLNSDNISLKGRRIFFFCGKKVFFNDEKERLFRGDKDGIGCTALFVFNNRQKKMVHNYDMAISYRPPMQKRIPSIRSIICDINRVYRQRRR